MGALRRLHRLHEGLEARNTALRDLDEVEFISGLSSFMLPAPELSVELSPSLPPGPNNELPNWGAWREFAHREHEAAEHRLTVALQWYQNPRPPSPADVQR